MFSMARFGLYAAVAWLGLLAPSVRAEAGSNSQLQQEIKHRLEQLRNKVHRQQTAIVNLEITNARQEETLEALRAKAHTVDKVYQTRAKQQTERMRPVRDEKVDEEHVYMARAAISAVDPLSALALETESSKDDEVPFPRTPTYRFQHQKIAFSALQYAIQTVPRHGLVHFDHELVNFRQSYDVIKGDFVCPLRGIYIFSASVSSSANSTCQVEIVNNGRQLGVASADSYGSRAVHDQGAVTVLALLNEGDRVWVRGLLPINHIGGDSDTMFSGALIWELP